MVMEANSSKADDLSWSEFGDLAWRYLRIPAALLLVEALYWFITIPSDTLAPIQVTEAWIWHNFSEFIFGEGATTYSTHNGWATRVDINHQYFPGGSIGLYVSDECAGVHEMIFITTLILLTDRVPWNLKKRTIAVMCGIVYVLNIARLMALYPIAVSSCSGDPGGYSCAAQMWQFHTFVYQWGFLLVLISMWLAWFFWVGGPKRVSSASKEIKGPLDVKFRVNWEQKHWAVMIFGLLLLGLAVETIVTDEDFNSARQDNNHCTALEEYSPNCELAEDNWNDQVGYVWSIATLGIIGMGYSGLEFSRKIENNLEDE